MSRDSAAAAGMRPGSEPWHGVHRALADPLRIRLFGALWHGPRSVKELAEGVGLPPDRLYYHLRQLERAKIIEIGGYRPLPNGKVERVYRRVEAEPPVDASSPAEIATFLGSVLDTTKADITAAFMAKAEGRRREAYVGRNGLRLTDEGFAELQRMLVELEQRYTDPNANGTWVASLIALVDLEDRPPAPQGDALLRTVG